MELDCNRVRVVFQLFRYHIDWWRVNAERKRNGCGLTMLLNLGGGQKKWVAPSGTGESHDFANIDVLGEFSGKEQQCRGFQVMTERRRRFAPVEKGRQLQGT
jgi:hypothetical protein